MKYKQYLYFLLSYYLFILSCANYISNDNELTGEGYPQQSKKSFTKLSEEPDCKIDLQILCPNLKDIVDDIDVFQCFQLIDPSKLSIKCQSATWSHLEQFISDKNLLSLFEPMCKEDVLHIRAKKCNKDTKLLACLLDHKDDISHTQCKNLLQLVEWIAFTDFRLISQFTDVCKTFVQKFTCGRVETDKSIKFTQGKTLECLQSHIDKLDGDCRHQVLHLSELQSDDIRLDHVLYNACVNDQYRLCGGITQGSGQIYKCLMDHTGNSMMSTKCREQLLRRQMLIATDYQVSKRLTRACKDDIRTNRCRRLVSDDRDIRLAQILVCLENAVHNGTKVSPDCQIEMASHRKMLLTDYRLSPEIVSRCSEDISTYCKGLETGGKTIHCLMEHARHSRKKDRISPPCLREVESLIKITDAGEDWRVDPVLKEACQPVVDIACGKISGGDSRVMSCLMDQLDQEVMTEPCEKALIQIQYFIARDFDLDPQLYRACHDEATRLCHAKKEWYKVGSMEPGMGPLVLPCLYRYLYHSENKLKLRNQCATQVRRVMRQRAESVHLLPDIEMACVDDLGLFCFDRTGPGEEMLCLQEKLSDLRPDCQAAVGNFTMAEVQDVQLNHLVMKYCGNLMHKYCDQESKLSFKENADMMDCLIKHKNEPSMKTEVKCHQALEHFQLVTAKDYHFTVAFKEACKYHAMRFCPSAKTKAQVIECLSTIITNDTLSEEKVRIRIPKNCRQQVKAQLLQQRENIDLDPILKTSCAPDVKKFCFNVDRGSAQVLECLLEHKSSVSQKCHKALFHIEQQDLGDSSTDYALQNTCKSMVKFYCYDEDIANALVCLKRYKDQPSFDEKCRILVTRRMIEQNEDYRFNPVIMRHCRPEISKFCVNVVAHQPKDTELEGKVIQCLKIKFREGKLRADCQHKLTDIIKEAALNYQLNPLLKSLCLTEIHGLCEIEDDEVIEREKGAVEECLKKALIDGKIRDRACRLEVAGLIEEGKADIHVDPILHKACSIDLIKYCSDVDQGNGRQLQCLELIAEKPSMLQPECQTMLNERMEMFRNADALVALPNSFQDIYNQVDRSPARIYILVSLFTFVGIIFLIGIFCGRVAARQSVAKKK